MGRGPQNRYELISCGVGGHVLVGTDAASVTPGDPGLAREVDGQRWHRCLRCDAWIPRPAPEDPARPSMPGRDEIAVPLRGPALRDRYVLRLIAVERAVHVVVYAGLAVVLFVYLGHRQRFIHDFDAVMRAVDGTANAPSTDKGILGKIRHYLVLNPSDLYVAAIVLVAYGVLEATEMVGLWFAKRWAEYLTFIATCGLIPLEVWDLTRGISVLRALTFTVNVAIAAYLLFAKRLFGVRGGHAALISRRTELGGWAAIDRATPAPGAPPSPEARDRAPAG